MQGKVFFNLRMEQFGLEAGPVNVVQLNTKDKIGKGLLMRAEAEERFRREARIHKRAKEIRRGWYGIVLIGIPVLIAFYIQQIFKRKEVRKHG